jgi:tRNA-guanine family transglycosylase
MFDCVWPTRIARFGEAITFTGTIALRHARYATDFGPMDANCICPCCLPGDHPSGKGMGITRALVHHIAAKETVGAHYVTMHNVHYLMQLMREARTAIVEDRYPKFVRGWFWRRFGAGEQIPSWAVDALRSAGVDLLKEAV